MQHFIVLKPDHLQIQVFKILLPLDVRGPSVIVAPTVKFDDHAGRLAKEVGHIPANGLLAPEFQTGTPAVSQFSPQQPFGNGRFPAKTASAANHPFGRTPVSTTHPFSLTPLTRPSGPPSPKGEG
jgi:hypothetical protein